MKSKNVLDLIKSNNLIIPNVLLKYKSDLKINEKELLLLAYLIDKEDMIPFDINLFSTELFMDVNELMNIISSLCDKNLIKMVVEKVNNVIKEFLDISLLYNKLLLFVLNEDEEAKEDIKSNVYSIIEKEFGRTLSPIEYETIKLWLDKGINEDLIVEALKEAILNGVHNLKYIDKIIYEWNRLGYKKPSDIKSKKKVSDEVIQVFDYDWLKDNE